MYTPVDRRMAEKDLDEEWNRSLELDSPWEFSRGRPDVLPHSAVDAHSDVPADDDWRQFHVDWIRGDEEIPIGS